MKKNITPPLKNNNFTEPTTTDELLNKYGTYEIQPTSATDNEYPKIAQGFGKNRKKKTGIRE